MALTSKKKSFGNARNPVVAKVASSVRADTKGKKLKKQELSTTLQTKLRKSTVSANKRLFLKDHEDTSPIRIVIADNTKAIIPRSHLQLALLSPFRFPLPSEARMAPFTRIAGIFFVVVGAIFSLLNLNYATGIVASSIEGDYSSNTLASVYTTTSAPNNTSIVSSAPEIRITVPNDGVIFGDIPVSVFVEGASHVLLTANNKDLNYSTTLGNARQIDNDKWVYEWQTNNLPNGTYQLAVSVTLSSGTFYKTDEHTYTIENEEISTYENATSPDIEDDPDMSTSTSRESTSLDESEIQKEFYKREITLSLQSETLSGRTSIGVSVDDATEVKVYAENVKSGNTSYVGSAKKVSDSEWNLTWKTESVIDGTYYIKAKAKVSNELIQSTPVRAVIVNGGGASSISTTVGISTSTEAEKVIPELEIDIAMLKPVVTMEMPHNNTLSGVVPIFIKSTPVDSIEIYAVGKNSNTPLFIGSPRKVKENEWKFDWFTQHQPNGVYSVYLRTKSAYGYYESDRHTIVIENKVIATLTPEQEEHIETYSKIPESLKVLSDGKEIILNDSLDGSGSTSVPSNLVYVESVESFAESLGLDEALERRLNEFRSSLIEKQNALARSIRDNDVARTEAIKQEIELMRNILIQDLPNSVDKEELIERINGYLAQVTFQTVELTVNNEKMIRDRIGDQVYKDSDSDNVSDYDEINLYRTNPFVADTDSDGHIDGAEIVSGFNPHDSSSESVVVYESPRESGFTREDLLIIENVTTVPRENTDSSDEVKPQALIYGKGLPNSFVTLFIYSTPVVVTVKTDDTGAWSYILDKTIEDGDHEVYVGIADNTGKIVAKSNPFSFVKTAEAYTASNNEIKEQQIVENPEPTLYESRMLLLVASIAVVALGLILILLGFHVRDRKEILPQSIAI